MSQSQFGLLFLKVDILSNCHLRFSSTGKKYKVSMVNNFEFIYEKNLRLLGEVQRKNEQTQISIVLPVF